jgi:hypothetical protein
MPEFPANRLLPFAASLGDSRGKNDFRKRPMMDVTHGCGRSAWAWPGTSPVTILLPLFSQRSALIALELGKFGPAVRTVGVRRIAGFFSGGAL